MHSTDISSQSASIRLPSGRSAENPGSIKVGYLQEVDVFRDLNAAEMAWVGSVTTMLTCERGRIIYLPGETGEVLFLLKKGRVQIYRLSLDGRKLVINVLQPGTFFGEMPLLGQGMHDAFAEAVDDCMLCAMSRHDLERLMLDKPRVALRMLGVVGRRLVDAESLLEDLAFKSVRARLASLLLRLAERQGQTAVEGLTHQDLAEMAGTYRETATQTLNQFKADGLVEIGRRRITLLDPQGLRAIATEA